jgi:hypothetical protein
LFNPTSDNSEVPIIWHLRRAVQRPEVLLFGRKTASLIKKAYKSVRISTVWYLLTPRLLLHTTLVMKTPDKTEEDPDDPEPAGEGDI